MIEELKKCGKAWAEFCTLQYNSYNQWPYVHNNPKVSLYNNDYMIFADISKVASLNDKALFNYPIRNLYDYFDKLGIYGEIKIDHAQVSSTRDMWTYCIASEGIGFDSYFHTRQEAEQALFIEMFKIRESQL